MAESDDREAKLSPEQQHAQNRRAFFGCLGILVVLAGLVLGTIYLIKMSGCSTETLLAAELEQAPNTYSFETEKPGVVQVWANMKFRFKGFSSKVGNDELPHLLDFVLAVEGPDGETRELTCNPLDSNIFKTSMESPGQMGDEYAEREYDGLIRGCAFRVKAGKHRLRAHLSWRAPDDDRFDFERTGLILRFAPAD